MRVGFDWTGSHSLETTRHSLTLNLGGADPGGDGDVDGDDLNIMAAAFGSGKYFQKSGKVLWGNAEVGMSSSISTPTPVRFP